MARGVHRPYPSLPSYGEVGRRIVAATVHALTGVSVTRHPQGFRPHVNQVMVRRIRAHDEIAPYVACPIPIYVVHYCATGQRFPQHPFDHKHMFRAFMRAGHVAPYVPLRVDIAHHVFDFMEPSGLRGKPRLALADTTRKLDGVLAPPIDNAFLWSTSCPGFTSPFFSIILRALLRSMLPFTSPRLLAVLYSCV